MEERDHLREYVERGGEQAFARLVESHVDLVHSTATRLVQDADLAKDICQSVFLLLARKAASVPKSGALAGWLYRATQFEAASLIRTEQRRRARESEAMRRAELEEGEETVTWTEIMPVLEKAMAQLKPRDQDAVVLRFFENKPLAAVGAALGLSEDAARKRVSRSLLQLQAYFRKRGVNVSAVSLAALLAGNAVQGAPAGLAASLAATAVAGTTASSLLTPIIPTLLMTKTTGTILTVVILGAIITPVLLKKSPEPQTQTVTAARVAPAAAEQGSASATPPRRTSPNFAAASGGTTLLARVALLAPLTDSQIEAYVKQNKRNAESLLAAYRASTNLAYLREAAQRFPRDPDVQYAVVVSRATPEVQRQWIEAYKTSSPDNALAWYFSALEYFRTGDTNRAIEDLMLASRKAEFRADLAPTLQALQELHVSAGRATDEARVAAFQSSAMVPHLVQMRQLANAMSDAITHYKTQGNAAVANEVAGSGLRLGAQLSAGGGSQTLINQLMGLGLQRKFLDQLDPPATTDPFGRPVADVRASIDTHRDSLREHAKTLTTLLSGMNDVELANYMERVKLYGEESALVWAKEKHGSER